MLVVCLLNMTCLMGVGCAWFCLCLVFVLSTLVEPGIYTYNLVFCDLPGL